MDFKIPPEKILHLPTTPTSSTSDPLGILKVSGIYGSGTWAGWFLTICASWVAILAPLATKEKRKLGIRHDMIMHIIFTNWAAVDLLQHLSLRKRAEDEDARKEFGGAIAAALTITFWGLHTMLWQLGVCMYFDKDSGTFSVIRSVRLLVIQYQRCVLLLAGSMLPSIALVVFATYLPGLTDTEDGIACSLPALYTEGGECGVHWVKLFGICSVGVWCLTFSSLCLVLVSVVSFHLRRSATGIIRYRSLYFDGELDDPSILVGLLSLSFCMSAIISFFLSGTHLLLTNPIALGMHVLFSVFFVCYALVLVGWQDEHSWIYILGALLLPDVLLIVFSHCGFLLMPGLHAWGWLLDAVIIHQNKKESCFAMPCALQKISDWDQAFGLVVGLIMLVVEMRPLVVRWISKKRREGRP